MVKTYTFEAPGYRIPSQILIHLKPQVIVSYALALHLYGLLRLYPMHWHCNCMGFYYCTLCIGIAFVWVSTIVSYAFVLHLYGLLLRYPMHWHCICVISTTVSCALAFHLYAFLRPYPPHWQKTSLKLYRTQWCQWPSPGQQNRREIQGLFVPCQSAYLRHTHRPSAYHQELERTLEAARHLGKVALVLLYPMHWQ